MLNLLPVEDAVLFVLRVSKPRNFEGDGEGEGFLPY